MLILSQAEKYSRILPLSSSDIGWGWTTIGSLRRIATLLQEPAKCGSRKQDLQVHLYGGACVLGAFSSGAREPIGEQNIRLATDTFSPQEIAVLRWDTGGSKGRKATMRTRHRRNCLQFDRKLNMEISREA